jgi:hypothetical protein
LAFLPPLPGAAAAKNLRAWARSGVDDVLLLPPVLATASVEAIEALEEAEAGGTGVVPLVSEASSSPPMLGASPVATLAAALPLPPLGVMSWTGVRG